MKAKTNIEHLNLPFEVAEKDLPGIYQWQQAMDLMPLLEDGWRLPTDKELNLLYINKDVVGGFAALIYWSSSEYDSTNAWGQSFSNGNQYNVDKTVTYYVRCVRDFC
jgi:hypothetical protein